MSIQPKTFWLLWGWHLFWKDIWAVTSFPLGWCRLTLSIPATFSGSVDLLPLGRKPKTLGIIWKIQGVLQIETIIHACPWTCKETLGGQWTEPKYLSFVVLRSRASHVLGALCVCVCARARAHVHVCTYHCTHLGIRGQMCRDQFSPSTTWVPTGTRVFPSFHSVEPGDWTQSSGLAASPFTSWVLLLAHLFAFYCETESHLAAPSCPWSHFIALAGFDLGILLLQSSE